MNPDVFVLKDEVVGAGEHSRAGNPNEHCKSNISTNYWMTAIIQTAGRHWLEVNHNVQG